MTEVFQTKARPEEAVSARLNFARAASASAGHEVTDQRLKDILYRHARGELTVDEALELGREHLRNN